MEVKREIEMGDGREGRRAEGQKGKMDGTMRRGIVICNAVQDCQDSGQLLADRIWQRTAEGDRSCADRVDTISWWWLRASQLLWVKVPIWLWSEPYFVPYRQCVGPASEALHKIHERRSLIAMSQETCQ